MNIADLALSLSIHPPGSCIIVRYGPSAHVHELSNAVARLREDMAAHGTRVSFFLVEGSSVTVDAPDHELIEALIEARKCESAQGALTLLRQRFHIVTKAEVG